jgi:hypothetical protein
MTQAEIVAAKLQTVGMKATLWDKKGQRVYINGHGRDIKAWFEFDSDDEVTNDLDDIFSGSRLRVYSDCNQGRQWLINRAQQVKHQIMVDLHEMAVGGDIKSATLAAPVCESWRDVIL